jgi:predicted PurR-regulated permease PerM
MPPRLPAGERLRRLGIAAWSLIGIVAVLVLAVYALAKVRIVFPPLVLALLIIYLANPIVSRLERRGVPRILGTFFSYLVVLGSFTVIVILLVPYVSGQVQDFSDEWPKLREQTVVFVEDTASSLEDRFGFTIQTTQLTCLLGADQIESREAPSHERCDEVTTDFRKRVTSRLGSFLDISRSVLEGLLVFILGPLLALYILIDLPNIQRDMLALVPEQQRDEMADLGQKVNRAFGGFIRGQLLVALSVGVLSALGFAFIGLPFWLIIGAIAGLFNLVPLIGPFIGGGVGFLVGTMTGGVGLGLKAALVELAVQQLDNHVISPTIMKKTVNLHPATVMLALLAGGTMGGIWGIFLAVPGVAVAKLLLGHIWATRVLGVEPSPHATPVAAGVAPSVVPDDPSEGSPEPDES